MLNSVILFFSILPVQNLHTVIQDTSIFVIWTNPDDTTIDYIQIQISQDNYSDTLDTTGTNVFPIVPLETDTVIFSRNFVSGFRYYFSVFTVDTNTNPVSYDYDTISSPSPYPPTILSFYPSGFLTDKNIVRIVFNDTMDADKTIHSINILSYHSGDTLCNYNIDLISRGNYRGNSYSDTFTFAIVPYPRCLDTVVVDIKSDSAVDIFGWKLDGNLDNVQQGSPDDDVSFAFYSSMLGDFNMDGVVDIQDLNGYFRKAILDNDITCDIGPAIGTVPYLQKEPDGLVNIEDVGVFIQMWTWSIQHSGVKLPYGVVSSNDVLYKFDNDTMNIFYNGNKDFTSAEVLLEGNIEKISRGNIFAKDAYLFSTKAGNITVIDIANPFPVSKGELLKIVCDRNTKVWIKVFTKEDMIVDAGEVYDQDNIKKYSINGVSLNILGVKKYKIFDITGRVVSNGRSTKSRILLPGKLSSGIYFLKLYYPIETKPIKLIKLK